MGLWTPATLLACPDCGAEAQVLKGPLFRLERQGSRVRRVAAGYLCICPTCRTEWTATVAGAKRLSTRPEHDVLPRPARREESPPVARYPELPEDMAEMFNRRSP